MYCKYNAIASIFYQLLHFQEKIANAIKISGLHIIIRSSNLYNNYYFRVFYLCLVLCGVKFNFNSRVLCNKISDISNWNNYYVKYLVIFFISHEMLFFTTSEFCEKLAIKKSLRFSQRRPNDPAIKYLKMTPAVKYPVN